MSFEILLVVRIVSIQSKAREGRSWTGRVRLISLRYCLFSILGHDKKRSVFSHFCCAAKDQARFSHWLIRSNVSISRGDYKTTRLISVAIEENLLLNRIAITRTMRMMLLPVGIFFLSLLAFFGRVHGQNRCEALIDLTLVIDSSGSISPDDFERAKTALIDLVSRLNVGVNKAGVALINFSSNISLNAVRDVFQFDQLELLKKIGALPRLGAGTATGDALALAKLYCDAQCRDINSGIPRIFAIFTDGHSNEGQPVIPAALALREAPIEGTIFAVGVGNIGVDGQAELLGITGDPDYVLNIGSYLDLALITNAISMKMCDIPAFILPDRRIQGEVTGNRSRYFRMNTLHKLAKNAFFEIQINDQIGHVSSSSRPYLIWTSLFFLRPFRRCCTHRRRIKIHHRIQRRASTIGLLLLREAKNSRPMFQPMRRISTLRSKVLSQPWISLTSLCVFDHWTSKGNESWTQ